MLTLIVDNSSQPETKASPAADALPILGGLYRCDDAPAYEYLTIGEVYECTARGKRVIGLHRPTDHAGTFINTHTVRSGRVVLTPCEAS